MSTLIGRPNDAWVLPEAARALGESAERALQRWWLWIPGIFYPSLIISVDVVQAVLGLVEASTNIQIPGARGLSNLLTVFGRVPQFGGWDLTQAFVVLLLALPLFVLIYRFVIGLAKVSDAQAEGRPGLRTVWRTGRGLGLPACGMWWILTCLLLGTLVFLIGPLVVVVELLGIRTVNAMLVGLLVPLLAVVLAYAIVLQVVFQLALHSMAHNRRGVASALTHGWRLIRASPWGALRATAVDFLLFLGFVLVKTAVVRVLDEPFGSLVLILVLGWVGATRAAYWSRAYRGLGGLSAADQVPGLQVETR